MPRAESLLPIAIIAGAVALAASEFMIAFEFTPPGGEPLREVTAADRHDYSSLILAIGALVALGIAIATGARPAAFAVAGIGGVALLLFLVIDLPDAGQLGDLSDPVRGIASARAEAQPGFWLQAVGALTLALAGGAFATFKPAQLQTWKGRLDRRRSDSGKKQSSDEPGSGAERESDERGSGAERESGGRGSGAERESGGGATSSGSRGRSEPYDGASDRDSSTGGHADPGGRRGRGRLAGLRRR